MRLRKFWTLGLAIAAAAVAPVRADESRPSAPTVVVRLKSFDGIVGDAKYLAELAGKGEDAKQIDGILKNLPVKNGLAGTGLDTKRPFLFYAVVTPDAVSSYGALLVPLADEKSFVSFLGDMLGNFGVTISKGDDGIYTVPIPNAPVESYFAIADGYVYITAKDKSTLAAANRFAPTKLLAGHDEALASASVRIDQVPDMLKQMALQQLDLRIAEVKDQKPSGETPAQTKLRTSVIDYVFRQIRNVVRDGGQLEARAVVDRAKGDISFDANLTGKPGTSLAKDISSLADRASLFASSLQGAMTLGVNLALPDELRDAGMNVIQEAFDKGMKNEKDTYKRALAQKMFDTLSPIARAGVINLGVNVRGPDDAGHYTIGFGMRVPDGKAIESLLKNDIAPVIPPAERSMLKLDAGKVGGLTVHRITPPADHQPPNQAKVLGKNPTILIAFGEKQVLGSLGADPEAALKSAAEDRSGSKSPPLSLAVSVTKLAPLVHQEKADEIAGLAKKTDAPTGSDLFSVRLEGGPALRFKVSMKALGITFLSKVHDVVH